MFRSHSRIQSSNSVSDFTQYNEKRAWVVEDDFQPSRQSTSRQRSLVYLLLLSEAIMAASLSAQIPLLVAASSTACSDYSSCSIFWGCATDRRGRKTIAMLGLTGSLACCLFMGFAKSLPGWVLLRFLAGCMGSAIFTSALAMLADLSMPSAKALQTVSRLPLISVCGGIGPLLQSLVRQVGEHAPAGIWLQWPALNGQIACAGLILAIFLVEAFCLREVSTVDRPMHAFAYKSCRPWTPVLQSASRARKHLYLNKRLMIARHCCPFPSLISTKSPQEFALTTSCKRLLS
jgi:MFS family permease